MNGQPDHREEGSEFDETTVRFSAAEALDGATTTGGGELDEDQRRQFEDAMVEVARSFKDRADVESAFGEVMGELAARDPQAAIDFMGGVEATRAKIGDEWTERLLKDIEEGRQTEN